MKVYVTREEYEYRISHIDDGWNDYVLEVPRWRYWFYVYAHRFTHWLEHKLDRFPYRLIHEAADAEYKAIEDRLKFQREQGRKLKVVGAEAALDGMPHRLYAYSERDYIKRKFEDLDEDEQRQIVEDNCKNYKP